MRLFLLFTALRFLTTTAYALDVTLKWDPHPNPDLDHYTLYQADHFPDKTGPWQKLQDIEKTLTTVTINTEPGKFFTWYITATNTSGTESGPSNTVSLYEPKPMDAPTCLGISP